MPLTAGISYSLYEGGKNDQKAVVLIHGAGGSHLDWPPEFRRLTGYTVYAMDLPGHGRSTLPGCQSVEEYAEALLEFLAAVGRFQAVFVGHSMGAAIALYLGLEFPQHVAGLGLFSAAACFDVPPQLVDYLSNPSSAELGIRIIRERLLTGVTSPEWVARISSSLLKVRTSVLYGDWLACARFDIRQRVNQIQAPAYIACGRNDRLTPPSRSRFLADQLPLARLDVIAECGHLLPMEQPGLMAGRLIGFLDDLHMALENPALWIKLPKKDPIQADDE
ncbi:MAG: alpha/beta hydrolase [Chloroflexota bacterium]|nr:MAG: alpha/beta hydrolase [Bellilinea sp.]